MEVVTIVLGRFIPAHQAQAVRDDAVLDLLFRYRINPQNQDNAPMKVPEIARPVASDPSLVLAALDALKEVSPPLIEEGLEVQHERTFRITGMGVRFVPDIHQDMGSLL